MRKHSKKLIAGAIAIAIFIGAGIAYAYWTATGSGTGSASTAAGVANNLDYNNNLLTAMYPGDDPQFLTVTVTNNDLDQATYVDNVKLLYIDTSNLFCDGSNFLVNGFEAPTSPAGPAVSLAWTAQELAAAGGFASTLGTDTIQFNNKPAVNQDDCKSVTVNLHYVTE
jgi:hypothetical protein